MYPYSSLPMVFTASGKGRLTALATAAPDVMADAPTAKTTLGDEDTEWRGDKTNNVVEWGGGY